MVQQRTTQDKVTLFNKRFIHMGSPFYRQWVSDKGHGYTVVRDTQGNDSKYTVVETVDHLKGVHTYAPQQVNSDGMVKWLCLDVDKKKGGSATDEDAKQQLRKLLKVVYKNIGKKYLIEDSGNRGYHVWIFFEPMATALEAYSLGHYFAEHAERVDGMGIEVYPKQVTAEGYGNSAKVPLGIHRKTNRRCFFIDHTYEPFTDQWEALENVETFDPWWINENISEYHTEVAAKVNRFAEDFELDKDIPLCYAHIFQHGVVDGARTIPTFYLALYLKRLGLTEEMTEAALDTWSRGDSSITNHMLTNAVTSAYQKSYKDVPCAKDEFDCYCTRTCPFFVYKTKIRWKNLGKEGSPPQGVISRD